MDRYSTKLFALLCVMGLLMCAGCGEEKPVPGDTGSTGTSIPGGKMEILDGQSDSAGSSGTGTEPGAAADDSGTTVQSGADEPDETVPEQPEHSWDVPRSEMVLKLGRIPFLQTRLMLRVHEPLLEYLAKRLGVKAVKLVLAEDYTGIVDYLKEGKIDITWIGTVAYVEAREKAGARPIVRPVRFGRDTYGSMIIVRDESSIKTVQDLKGKSFAFVDPDSASGCIFPLAYMLGHGVDPDVDFKKVDYLKEHDSVVMAVFFKKFAAGAVYDDARDKLGPENKGQLRVLARIPEIPNEPIVVHPDMPEALVKDITAAFLDLTDNKEFLDDFNSRINDQLEGFKKASDKEYESVRQLMKNLEKK